jgi:hypothetical protein
MSLRNSHQSPVSRTHCDSNWKQADVKPTTLFYDAQVENERPRILHVIKDLAALEGPQLTFLHKVQAGGLGFQESSSLVVCLSYRAGNRRKMLGTPTNITNRTSGVLFRQETSGT